MRNWSVDTVITYIIGTMAVMGAIVQMLLVFLLVYTLLHLTPGC